MRKFLTSIFEKITEKLRENEHHVAILGEGTTDDVTQPKAKKAPKKRKPKEAKSTVSVSLPDGSLPSISLQKMKQKPPLWHVSWFKLLYLIKIQAMYQLGHVKTET
jgi:hypothetical protein